MTENPPEDDANTVAEPPETQGESVNPASPDVNPDANTTTPKDDEEDENPSDGPVVQTRGSKFVFTVAGRQTTDFTAVQSRLNMLENFRNETLTQARRSFVENLAKDNKITAKQIDSLQQFALSLTDEGYDSWRATWDDAPVMSLFGVHAEGTTNHDGSQNEAREKEADKVNVWRETVMQHKAGGMAHDKIMQTPSYQNLVAADPTFKL